jgi:ferredoxin/flavodoxin
MNNPLKSVIFFYSQIVTGNTKKIAEQIAAGLRKNNNHCKIIPLTKYKKDLQIIKSFPFEDFDLIGIGTPVYYFHPPYHILFELEEFPNLGSKLGFLFCTSGGNPGSTLYQMKKVLDTKGLKLIDGYDQWIGWDVHQMYKNKENSNGHYGWLPSSYGHPNKQELKQARIFGEKLLEKSLLGSSQEKTGFWKKKNESAKMWSWKGIQEWFPEFYIEKDKCTRCGLCTQICPWDSIILDPYPKWTKDCDRCYICDLKCPEQAIQCDFSEQIQYLDNLMKRSIKKK